jgi:diketogulonate reductase-like aldo/keto reductase
MLIRKTIFCALAAWRELFINQMVSRRSCVMEYRRLGSAGLKVSVLSFGSWVSFKNQLGTDMAHDCMVAAYDAGVNFFDNAEAYAGGESEVIMGEVLRRTGWRRESYIISTKFFWGLNDGPNERNTLNRKYLLQAMDKSLKRWGMEYVDLVFCHRPDPHTPIEETVWAMHDLISQGKALYWGTSEWSADQLMEAWQIAERHHLRKPQMEQPPASTFRSTRAAPLASSCCSSTMSMTPPQRGHRVAGPAAQPHLRLLAHLCAGQSRRPDLRLPRRWPLRTAVGPAFRPRQGAARSLRPRRGHAARFDRRRLRRRATTPAQAMKSVVVDVAAMTGRATRRCVAPSADTIIYEMHVRGFTATPASGRIAT